MNSWINNFKWLWHEERSRWRWHSRWWWRECRLSNTDDLSPSQRTSNLLQQLQPHHLPSTAINQVNDVEFIQSVDHWNLVCYDSNLLQNQEKLFLQRSIRLAIIQNCRTVGRSIRIHRIYIFRLHKMLHLPIEATIWWKRSISLMVLNNSIILGDIGSTEVVINIKYVCQKRLGEHLFLVNLLSRESSILFHSELS